MTQKAATVRLQLFMEVDLGNKWRFSRAASIDLPTSNDEIAVALLVIAGPWLQAWYDPVAGLKVMPQSLRLVDLAGDNDYRLMCADLDKRLKVYRGAYKRGCRQVCLFVTASVVWPSFHVH